jgi:hypothetical protein
VVIKYLKEKKRERKGVGGVCRRVRERGKVSKKKEARREEICRKKINERPKTETCRRKHDQKKRKIEIAITPS